MSDQAQRDSAYRLTAANYQGDAPHEITITGMVETTLAALYLIDAGWAVKIERVFR